MKAPAARRLSRLITIGSFATENKMSYWAARRFLLRLDARAKGTLLFRVTDNPRGALYTTLERLRRVDPGLVEERRADQTRLESVEKKTGDLQLELRSAKSRMRAVVGQLEERLAGLHAVAI